MFKKLWMLFVILFLQMLLLIKCWFVCLCRFSWSRFIGRWFYPTFSNTRKTCTEIERKLKTFIFKKIYSPNSSFKVLKIVITFKLIMDFLWCGSSSWEGNKQHFNTNVNHSLAKKGSSKPTTKSFGSLNIFSWLVEQRKVLQQACKQL